MMRQSHGVLQCFLSSETVQIDPYDCSEAIEFRNVLLVRHIWCKPRKTGRLGHPSILPALSGLHVLKPKTITQLSYLRCLV